MPERRSPGVELRDQMKEAARDRRESDFQRTSVAEAGRLADETARLANETTRLRRWTTWAAVAAAASALGSLLTALIMARSGQ
jgi:hypothetical protein